MHFSRTDRPRLRYRVPFVWKYRRGAQAGERYDLSYETGPVALSLRLAGLVIWLYPPVYVVFPGWVAWAGIPLPVPLRLAAAGVALFAVLPLLVWAQRHLGRSVTTTVVTKEGHELVTSGPYRWIWHPLYTIGLLFFFSLSILSANLIPLAAELIVFIALLARLPKEEDMLIERFGDEYREYLRRTGRFLPRLG